jgi:putative ABC transport system permease protein
MDGSAIAFTLLLSLITGLIVGLAPIAQTATDAYGTLRETTAAPTRQSRRLREILVVAEVALALVLLVGAGLLVRSFANLRAVPLGFAPERVITMTVDLPVARYAAVREVITFHRQLLSSLAALPNVSSAGAVNWLPLGDMLIGGDVQADDRPDLVGKFQATKAVVSPRYFTTMGIPVVRGRDFTDSDIAGSAPVVIVSESVARRFWVDADPLGKRVSLQDNPKPRDWVTVVGVVKDVRQEGLRAQPALAVYRPYAQVTGRFSVGYMTFVVRTDGDPAQAAPLMRAALNQLDTSLAPQSLSAMERVIERTIAEPKFHSRALSVFSLTALLLAAIGVDGVLASSVLERRVEIGIRMALGADSTSVVRMVLRRSLLLTGFGIVLGLAGSFAVTGALSRFLFNVTPTDLPSFAIASGILVASAVAAALLPARRASAIDPLVALRTE